MNRAGLFLVLFKFRHRVSPWPLRWCRHAIFNSAKGIRRLLLRNGHTIKAHRDSSPAAGRHHILVERARCGWPACGARCSAWRPRRAVAVHGADSRSGSSLSATRSSPGETHKELMPSRHSGVIRLRGRRPFNLTDISVI